MVGDEEHSRVAEWEGDLIPPTATDGQLRTAAWARHALRAASDSAGSPDAATAWISAVQATWWVAALNDLYRNVLVGAAAYDAAIEQDPCGRIVWGMRWLRHVHIHDLRISARGGPKRNFFGGGPLGTPGFGPPFYISPSNCWLAADELAPAAGEKSPKDRARYDERVAGMPVRMTLEAATRWFDRLADACHHSWEPGDVDPTVL